jgi:hypothetical protein
MTMKNKLSGHPPQNPDDLKSAEIALRIHPDLNSELIRMARLEGISKSALINHQLIRLINDRRNRTVVDNIGRHPVHKIRVA